MSMSESLVQQFSALRAGYLAKLADKVAELRGQHQALGSRFDRDNLINLHFMLHNLAGSGSTFGFHTVSEAARRGESLVTEVLNQHLVWNDSTQLLLSDALTDLENAVAGYQQEEPTTVTAAESGGPWLVILLAPDNRYDNLVTPLMQFGYQVKHVKNAAGLEKAVRDPAAGAIVAEQTDRNLALFADLLKTAGHLPPIVFIADRDDFEHRLKALRVGGRAYFTAPVDADELLACLTELTTPFAGADYRVLLVDDDAEVGRYHGLLLEKAGLKVRVVQSAAQALRELPEFEAEVIITDLYMPDCDGLELAALLRQVRRAAGVPIIFLSSEQRMDYQIQAIRAGGNDFLTKPVKPEHLVFVVISNARRYRNARALMTRDSLTGLINHTATRTELETEIARARRTRTPLSFALLDIDHFKRVNDGFSHAVGDRVLKGFAHLLLQRLRRSDSVGRIGGEEFALILPNTALADAVKVLEDVRERFGQIRHATPDGDFFVQLSGGVAELQPEENAMQLEARADTALYKARERGRNRVESA